ncbi:MAG: hypothetical protein P8098_17920 [Candidatus Thiodiazotropha sp.]
MAFYFKIEKTDENDSKVTYRFTGDRGVFGLFEIDKGSGEFTLKEPMPGDEAQNIYRRASVKVLREWREGNLPEKTEWAS